MTDVTEKKLEDTPYWPRVLDPDDHDKAETCVVSLDWNRAGNLRLEQAQGTVSIDRDQALELLYVLGVYIRSSPDVA